jgi:ATP-dependent protease ClpP protease subunit
MSTPHPREFAGSAGDFLQFGGSAVTLIGVPARDFNYSRTEGLEWLNLTSRLALNGIIFLPHQLRTANTNIMMGLVIHHDLEARGGIYLLVNSVGGSLQAALGLHD